MPPQAVSFLIPNFNGKSIMEACLPSLMTEVEARGFVDEVIVADNASEDGSAEFLREKYPSILVQRHETNKAIFSLNDAARAARHDIVFFLNNDCKVEPGFIAPILPHFDDPSTFAVTTRIIQWDQETLQTGRRLGAVWRGLYWNLNDPDPDRPGPSIQALGGQAAIDKKKFFELGMLDELFSPFYHEDLDLSYRAWRKGWRTVYEPRSVLYHMGAATAKKYFRRRRLDAIMQKNLFLFTWKNIHDPAMTRAHLACLPLRLAQAAVRGDLAFLEGFLGALRQAPAAAAARKAAKAAAAKTDREILALFAEDILRTTGKKVRV